eukprot:TRINITY_DN7146_c0_g1_i1.p1 TRINITY_DN7146_c0_g1~~TRINITY_DN7146_c0_g1_i1.p1  ORF type:complete len:439 (+),score=92.31 TRINITY_DN7146_c0_g1_i1:16-1332(+)
MATSSSPNGANGAASAVSKTKLLRDLYSDVQQLKQDIEPAVQVSVWVKDQFKPTMKKMKDMIEAEVQNLRTDLTSTDAYAKNITQWIKDNLGTKLEKITEMLQQTVQAQLERQAEEAKLREESLWSIFNTKFDNYLKQAEQERAKYDAQAQAMAEEMKKIHSLRIQMEQSHATMKQTHELVVKESRERPEQEMQMFRKLTKKLEEERIKIEQARQQMEDERRRMEEERSKFDKALEEERKRLQDRQMIEYERKKLEDERQLLLAAQSRMISPQTQAPPPASVAPPATILAAPAPSIPQNTYVAPTPAAAEMFAWLKSEGFENYASTFAQFGYHSMSVIALLDEEDLKIMGITLPGHRKGLLAAAAKLRDSAVASVFALSDPRGDLSTSSQSSSSSSSIAVEKSEPESTPITSSNAAPKPAARKLPLPGNRPLPKAPPQ